MNFGPMSKLCLRFFKKFQSRQGRPVHIKNYLKSDFYTEVENWVNTIVNPNLPPKVDERSEQVLVDECWCITV